MSKLTYEEEQELERLQGKLNDPNTYFRTIPRIEKRIQKLLAKKQSKKPNT